MNRNLATIFLWIALLIAVFFGLLNNIKLNKELKESQTYAEHLALELRHAETRLDERSIQLKDCQNALAREIGELPPK